MFLDLTRRVCSITRSFEVTKILCVDDSPEMLDILTEMLDSRFLVVGALTSGAAVLAQVAVLKPDIILLDIDLGDMNGFLLAQRLRDMECRAKIVFVSAHEGRPFVKAAHDAGAAFVGKSQLTRDLVKTLLKVDLDA
jgi:two-component system, chemotaxis family, response regulator PixG